MIRAFCRFFRSSGLVFFIFLSIGVKICLSQSTVLNDYNISQISLATPLTLYQSQQGIKLFSYASTPNFKFLASDLSNNVTNYFTFPTNNYYVGGIGFDNTNDDIYSIVYTFQGNKIFIVKSDSQLSENATNQFAITEDINGFSDIVPLSDERVSFILLTMSGGQNSAYLCIFDQNENKLDLYKIQGFGGSKILINPSLAVSGDILYVNITEFLGVGAVDSKNLLFKLNTTDLDNPTLQKVGNFNLGCCALGKYVQVDSENNIILVGENPLHSSSSKDVFVVKSSPDFNSIVSKSYNSGQEDNVGQFTTLDNGNFLLTMTVDSLSNFHSSVSGNRCNNKDVMTLLLDPNLDVIDASKIGAASFDYAFKSIPTTSNNQWMTLVGSASLGSGLLLLEKEAGVDLNSNCYMNKEPLNASISNTVSYDDLSLMNYSLVKTSITTTPYDLSYGNLNSNKNLLCDSTTPVNEIKDDVNNKNHQSILIGDDKNFDLSQIGAIQFDLYNLQGMSMANKSNAKEFDFASLPSGTYIMSFLNIKNDQKTLIFINQ